MSRKRHKPEEIVARLRQVEVLIGQGRTVAEAIRSIGVTEVTFYRCRQEYVGLKGDQVKRLKELGGREHAAPARCLGSHPREPVPQGGCSGPRRAASAKLLSLARRRACIEHVVAEHGASERMACRVLGQRRSTQRKGPTTPDDEAALTAEL